MSTKKRKPLGSAMEECVFGTNEAASPTPQVVLPAATPTASLAPETALPATPPFASLPVATPAQPEVLAPEPVSIQSKEPSLMSKLQAPDKEATVRFTVDMSVGGAPQAVHFGGKDGAQESRLLVRMLLEDGLKEVEG